MFVKSALVALTLLISTSHIFAQVAIIPYKTINPAKGFPPKTGPDYAKLLTTTALCSKEINILSPQTVTNALKKLNINAALITNRDLQRLSRTRQVDYILYGKLIKIKNHFRVKSVVYSTKDNSVISKTDIKAYTLFKLAEKEVSEVFTQFKKKPYLKTQQNVDTVFIIDASYQTNPDWSSIKKAIHDYSSFMIDELRINSNIYIIPFSGTSAINTTYYSGNSILSVKNALKKIKPRGNSSVDQFLKALRHAVKDIQWRKNSTKKIIILSNTDVNQSKGAEGYALYAKRKGIMINCVSLGMLTKTQSAAFQRIAEITGGTHYHSAYYQKAFNVNGEAIDLFMENGRLFTALSYDNSWKQGLFNRDKFALRSEEPRPFLSEIFIDNKKYKTHPYQLTALYTKITDKHIINHKPLQNNIISIFNTISESQHTDTRDMTAILGKALVTDNNISFWIYIRNNGQLASFKKLASSRRLFPLGIVVKKNKNKSYGLEFAPIDTIISADYIPEIAYAPLIKIIKNRHKYMTQGIFHPPIWFIKVRIKRFVELQKEKDVLDF